MIKIGIIFFAFIGLFQTHQSQKVLNQEELELLRKTFDWEESSLLIINYKEPGNNCFYNNYKKSESSFEWWQEFYSELEMSDSRNIYVYADSFSGINDRDDHYFDQSGFLLHRFFNKKETCYGVIIINSEGEYLLKNGEYSKEEVATMMNSLR